MAKNTVHGGATDVNQDGETVVVGVPTVGVPRIGEGGGEASVSHVEGENVLLTDVNPTDESATEVTPDATPAADESATTETPPAGDGQKAATDNDDKSKPRKSTAPKA